MYKRQAFDGIRTEVYIATKTAAQNAEDFWKDLHTSLTNLRTDYIDPVSYTHLFGAMQGALWGPVVFLWITFGTIFAGGVHDYFSGMMSERNDGASIAEVTGRYLGPVMQNIMRCLLYTSRCV